MSTRTAPFWSATCAWLCAALVVLSAFGVAASTAEGAAFKGSSEAQLAAAALRADAALEPQPGAVALSRHGYRAGPAGTVTWTSAPAFRLDAGVLRPIDLRWDGKRRFVPASAPHASAVDASAKPRPTLSLGGVPVALGGIGKASTNALSSDRRVWGRELSKPGRVAIANRADGVRLAYRSGKSDALTLGAPAGAKFDKAADTFVLTRGGTVVARVLAPAALAAKAPIARPSWRVRKGGRELRLVVDGAARVVVADVIVEGLGRDVANGRWTAAGGAGFGPAAVAYPRFTLPGKSAAARWTWTPDPELPVQRAQLVDLSVADRLTASAQIARGPAQTVVGPSAFASTTATGNGTLVFSSARTKPKKAPAAKAETAVGRSVVTLADSAPPAVAASAPQEWTTPQGASVDVVATDAGSGLAQLAVDGADGSAIPGLGECFGPSASPCPAKRSATLAVPGTGSGARTVRVNAVDASGRTASAEATVKVDADAPTLEVSGVPSAPLQGPKAIEVDVIGSDAGGSGIARIDVLLDGTLLTSSGTCDGNPCSAKVHQSISAASLPEGSHDLSARVQDRAGNSHARTWRIEVGKVTPGPGPGGENPPEVNPEELSQNRWTTPREAYDFLFEGTDPAQRDADQEKFIDERLTVLRAKVVDREGKGVDGVTLTVDGHPEFGTGKTFNGGQVHMLVNGGDRLTVRFTPTDGFAVDRVVQTQWGGYTWLDDVVVTTRDPRATQVEFGAASAAQQHVGTEETDAQGPRTPRLYLPPGIEATAELPDGSTRAITSSKLRVTEYTVGDRGPAAMPAPLPPRSGYTYAAEYELDEARVLGADGVRFSKPIYSYLDNFTGVPVGSWVPYAIYDRKIARWVPQANGIVLKVVGESDGLAVFSRKADGTPMTAAELDEWDFTDQERRFAALEYGPGDQLWRVPMTHFSPGDLNWLRWQNDAEPDGGGGGGDGGGGGGCEGRGSVVDCLNRTVQESIEVPGAPFDLVWDSTLAKGDDYARTIDLTIGEGRANEAGFPIPLHHLDVTVEIAGRRFTRSFDPKRWRTVRFIWDGKDAFGRVVPGSHEAKISMINVYSTPSVMGIAQDNDEPPIFGRWAGWKDIAAEQRSEFGLGRFQTQMLRVPYATDADLGGWKPDVWHRFDPVAQTVVASDPRQGKQGSARVSPRPLELIHGGRFALNGAEVLGDGTVVGHIPGWRSQIDEYANLRGDLLVALKPDGSHELLAGGGENDDTIDGAPAKEAWFREIASLDIDTEGRPVFEGWGAIYRLEHDGTIKRLAGMEKGGCEAPGGGGPIETASARGREDGPAAASLPECNTGTAPEDLAKQTFRNAHLTITSDNSIWVSSETFPQRLIRIDENGQVEATGDVVPDGVELPDTPPYDQDFRVVRGLATDPQDAVVVLSTAGLAKVRVDGTIDELTTSYPIGASHPRALEPGQTLRGGLGLPYSIEVAADGTYFLGGTNGAVFKLDPGEGTETAAIAGTGKTRPGENLDPDDPDRDAIMFAFEAVLPPIIDLAVEPSGALAVIASTPPGFDDVTSFRIDPKKTGLQSEYRVPSADGSQVLVFDEHGLQTETRDALTNANVLSFEYDGKSRLTAIVEASGDRTTIDRDAAGKVTGISRSGDEILAVSTNADGLLDYARPAGGGYQILSYDNRGLLTGIDRETGDTTTLKYDAIGRLTDDLGSEGRATHLTGGIPGDRGPGDNQWFVLDDSYDARDITTTKTDGEGRVSQMRSKVERDGSRLVSVANAAGEGARREVAPDGQVTVTAPNGTVSKAHPGGEGLSAGVQDGELTMPSGKKLTLNASSRTRAVSGTDLLTKQVDSVKIGSFEMSSTWNAGTREGERVSGEGRTLKTKTDGEGNALRIEAAEREPIEFERNERGDPTRISQGDRRFDLLWSDAGDLEGTTDALGRTTSIELGSDGSISAQTDPAGGRTEYKTDVHGEPWLIRTPGGNLWRTLYGSTGRVTEVEAPWNDDGQGTRFEYDNGGLPTATIAPNGERVDQTYDDSGRLSTITGDGATTQVEYSDASQRPSAFQRDTERVEYDYDGELPTAVRTTGRVPSQLELEYDDDLQIKATTVNGSRVSQSRDRDGLLTRTGPVGLHRDAETGAETGSEAGVVATEAKQNAYGELDELAVTAGGSPILTQTIERRKDGTVGKLEETTSQGSRTIDVDHDVLGRITSATDGSATRTFTYDADGNRTKETLGGDEIVATYDDAGRLAERAGTIYEYDDLGRLTRRERSDGKHLDLTYAGLGDVKTLRAEDGAVRRYSTDALGRTVEESVDGAVDRRWAYGAGIAPEALLAADGSVETRFIYGTRAWVPDAMIRNGKTYRFVRDQRESVRAIVDVASGEVVQERDYDLWGRTTRDTAPGFQPFGFTGGIDVPGVELVRLGARLYDPEIGRWTSPDPLVLEADELNPYLYVGADPLSYVDWSGYFLSVPNPIDVVTDAATAAAAAAAGFADDMSGGLATDLLDDVLPDSMMDELCSNPGYDVGKAISVVTSVIPAKALARTVIRGASKVARRKAGRGAAAGRGAGKDNRATAGNAGPNRGKTPEQSSPKPSSPNGGNKKPRKPKNPDGAPPKPSPGPKKPDDKKPGRNPGKGKCSVGPGVAAANSCGWDDIDVRFDRRYTGTGSPFKSQYDDLVAAKVSPQVHHTIPQDFRSAFRKFDIDHPCLTTAIGKDAHLGNLHRGWGGGKWNSEFRRRVQDATNKDPKGAVAFEKADFPKVLAVLDTMAGLDEFRSDDFKIDAYKNGGSTKVPMNHRKSACSGLDFAL